MRVTNDRDLSLVSDGNSDSPNWVIASCDHRPWYLLDLLRLLGCWHLLSHSALFLLPASSFFFRFLKELLRQLFIIILTFDYLYFLGLCTGDSLSLEPLRCSIQCMVKDQVLCLLALLGAVWALLKSFEALIAPRSLETAGHECGSMHETLANAASQGRWKLALYGLDVVCRLVDLVLLEKRLEDF